MPIKTHLFLDFDHTQFDGHLHNILTNYLFTTDHFTYLEKKQIHAELTGEKEITDLSKEAIRDAISRYKNDVTLNKNHKSLDFFDGQGLNEAVKEFQKMGVDVMVLTASGYPNAITALYDMNNLEHLKNLQILRVPITNPRQMAEDKNAMISLFENKAHEQGTNTILNFFVDDSAVNIEVFRKSREGKHNVGILVPKGLTPAVLNNLKQDVASKMTIHQEVSNTAVLDNSTTKLSANNNQEDRYGFIHPATGELTTSNHKYREEIKPDPTKIAHSANNNRLNSKEDYREEDIYDVYGSINVEQSTASSHTYKGEKKQTTISTDNLMPYSVIKEENKAGVQKFFEVFKRDKHSENTQPIATTKANSKNFSAMTTPINKSQQNNSKDNKATKNQQEVKKNIPTTPHFKKH